ncbi:MAG: c-type cytochrome biogenesis protein CcsB [Deltaproteobacteria bacterium CG_4_8_14_3_um_filter_51_11]|nr:c-type cytochrome biogenesis protein CcsB [bacterium]OIP40038.1 MAG: c-type cytochrome biogenesis protein CcsB [Desulfobacteraceae bacterium CG2_30_51_40]PIP45629.1 MAG: c-type cytochrome biogenesis protein CcsB [Deltaproteobacteria bacterium CG23_combo_of_CG06-09_8_20_14_all_51_20]PIX20240.1 MAG: c-type cytochrome biogenesis protein CcsB [Deltaproteobacteria bacterium CG_4_8_14_3_um_filter_51_11]PJB39515.1 MAG: c-type cytochrome biogenesis protein CcsB [Deltaproteobacteria bacterium CG_4_9_
MTSSAIISYLTFVYFLAFVFYLVMMVMGRRLPGTLATYTLLGSFAAQTAAIILRWQESYALGMGRAPFSNLYESLIFFAWTLVLLYLIVEWRTKNKSAGAFVTPLIFLALAYASFSPNISSKIMPLIPALKSNWLITHVITCFLGYAAFALSFGFSLMYLFKGNDSANNTASFLRLIPARGILDELNYQMVVIGFLMLTLGIITGSVWAHSAWGSYWSWDPKETWSLITWLVYAAVIHSRLVRGWKGRKIIILCIVGFACVLFTYFGVNYLAGLHSYATS